MPFKDVERRREYQREYYRPRALALYRRYRVASACGSCGMPVERFARCFVCRWNANERKRAKRWGEA